MVISIDSLSEPVGSIKQWIRPDAATPLPSNWLICDGSTVVDAASPFNGKVLPDLRTKFPRGHSTLDNSNFSADVNYFTGGTIPTGGNDSHNTSHAHGMSTHDHTVANHDHSFSDTSANNLPLSGQGFPGIGGTALAPEPHTHTVSGTTGSNGPSATGTGGPASTFAAGGSFDNKPQFTELLSIIKVR